MFKKLLSNLPFNPSLIQQISFYAKRVKGERSIRKTGLIFVVLAMLVQVFAVISPPEPTLAESANDIIRGGFSSRDQAVNYCRNNTQDFADILAYYKITCDTVATATTKTIKSTDQNNQLDSMGRTPQGPTNARTGKPTDEYSVPINGTQYYMRNLWSWDDGPDSTYQVLEMQNADGTTIMIMFSCGNIVTIGQYTPPPPPEPPKDVCPNIPGTQTTEEECDVCPNVPGIQTNPDQCYPCPKAQKDQAVTACLEMNKTAANQTQNIANANGTTAQPGDTIVYTLSAKNTGTQTVKDFIMDENLADVLEYADIVDTDGANLVSDTTLVWSKEDIKPETTMQKTITVKIKNPLPNTPASASDPDSYDLHMNNVFYGNSVSIQLPPSISKSTEMIVQTLPNTGPGATLALAFGITAVVGYFFARSRLIAKELDIVKEEFVSAGGV